MLEIGEKIKRRRVSLGLTQEELAARVELSKGFISQVERDLTSPSIATLTDILEALGMSLADFFSQEDTNEKVVFGADDVFVKEMRTRAIQYIGLYQTPRRTPWSPYL